MDAVGRGKKITIREIADQSGVSVATVSAVLNGTRHVGPATAERVNAVIRRTGYRPSRIAQGLSTSRSRTVGIVMPTILSPTAPPLLKSATDVLRSRGFSVLFSNTEMHSSWEDETVELMLDSQVDGLLAVPAAQHSPALESFIRSGKPTVLMMHGLPADSTCDTVKSGNFRGSFDAVTHLAQQGCARIAVLALPAATESEEDRVSGYRAALSSAGLAFDPELVRTGEPSESGASDTHGYEQTRLLMQMHPRPDGIFVLNQYMAIGALAALKDLQIRIPDDVAIVGYDDLLWTRHLQPALSVVAQGITDIGRIAANQLLRRLDGSGDEDAPMALTVDTKLIIRQSSDRMQTDRIPPAQ